jgi:hypothetical protein
MQAEQGALRDAARDCPARLLPGNLDRVPPELVRGLGQTVHGQIEDWLAGAIAAGQLAPGEPRGGPPPQPAGGGGPPG